MPFLTDSSPVDQVIMQQNFSGWISFNILQTNNSPFTNAEIQTTSSKPAHCNAKHHLIYFYCGSPVHVHATLTMGVQGAQTFSYILVGHYLITHVHASTHIHIINAYGSPVTILFMCSQVHEIKCIYIYNQPLLLKYLNPILDCKPKFHNHRHAINIDRRMLHIILYYVNKNSTPQ